MSSSLFALGGHPFQSPLHNGSAIDVAILVESFSNLGSHCISVFGCVLYVIVPLYLIILEVAAARAGLQFGSALTRALHDAVHAFDVRRPSTVTSVTGASTEGNEVSDASPDEPICVDHGVRHMAVIMDGNRRFGRKCFGSGLKGHEAGGDALLRFIVWSKERRIPMLTVYAFSTENWNRSAIEVSMLMTLFRNFFTKIRSDAATHAIRIRFLVSESTKLAPDILELMKSVEAETRRYNGIVVNVCVSYSGRASLVAATKRLHRAAVEPTDDVIRAELSRSVCEDDLPCPLPASSREVTMGDGSTVPLTVDPDVLFRTSHEQRLSNFMLYELAYTEMFFVDELWPEVKEGTVDRVLRAYASGRDRRFGK